MFSSDIKDDAHVPLVSEEPPTPISNPVSECLIKREFIFISFLFLSSSNYVVNSVTEVDSSKVISNVSYKSFQIIGARKHTNYCHPVIMANTNWLHGINEYTDWWNKQTKKKMLSPQNISAFFETKFLQVWTKDSPLLQLWHRSTLYLLRTSESLCKTEHKTVKLMGNFICSTSLQ